MKQVGRDWYPNAEERLHRNSHVEHIAQHIMPHVPRTRCVVQAGGAVGIWPREFAKYFSEVYSFEPNPLMVECFMQNCQDDRVVLNTHGLWKEPCWGEMVEEQSNNLGAWYFKPKEDGGIYVDTIDSYDLDHVDLIQLDIEGAEYEALQGAAKTIERCKPVIVVEAKMTQHFYGREVSDLYSLLHKLGYQSHSAFARDQLWVPR